jgi:hypothetical protein
MGRARKVGLGRESIDLYCGSTQSEHFLVYDLGSEVDVGQRIDEEDHDSFCANGENL